MVITFSRHQLVSVLATSIDYSVMVFCVIGLCLSPVAGTALGAFFGALTSFTLGRDWVFRARDGYLRSQAIRYAFVSVVSLCLNASGEWLLLRLQANYILGRIIVSIIVGIAWNYPLHRHFVFRLRPMLIASGTIQRG
jgi:putative flippase GtrA